LATGWSVALGKPGMFPAHLDSNGSLIIAPLSGRLYARPLNSNLKTTITTFYIDSGASNYFNFGQIPETAISGNQIIGWDLFYSLSGAEDLSVTLHGRYNDLYQENISDGVIMTSGDAAVSFFLEYGALTGDGVLEYYMANEFIATRWGVYAGSPGTSTLSLNPFATQYPLSGRFYFRDPKDNIKTTIAHFNLQTGSVANWNNIVPDFYIPFRKIVGVDIFYGLNDLKNVHIILGGKGIASANYYQNIITKNFMEKVNGFESINMIPWTGTGISENLPYQEGRMYYNSGTHTYNFYMDKPDVTLNLGQEQYLRAINKTSNQINNGEVLYISGYQGNRPKVWPANASSAYHRNHLIGMATHDIPNNEEGFITTFGVVNNINTSQFVSDDIVYLSEITDGAITNSPGTYSVKVGYALNATNNGSVLIKI
jgi:hypothetical protein